MEKPGQWSIYRTIRKLLTKYGQTHTQTHTYLHHTDVIKPFSQNFSGAKGEVLTSFGLDLKLFGLLLTLLEQLRLCTGVLECLRISSTLWLFMYAVVPLLIPDMYDDLVLFVNPLTVIRPLSEFSELWLSVTLLFFVVQNPNSRKHDEKATMPITTPMAIRPIVSGFIEVLSPPLESTPGLGGDGCTHSSLKIEHVSP